DAQILAVQRLPAQRHAMDPGGPIAATTFRLRPWRIGLEGAVAAGRPRPIGRDRGQGALHGWRLHQRGRAAAAEDAGPLARTSAGAHRRHLAFESGSETLLIHGLMADMAVEVAIGAFGRAEGPMHIDAESRRLIRSRCHTPSRARA